MCYFKRHHTFALLAITLCSTGFFVDAGPSGRLSSDAIKSITKGEDSDASVDKLLSSLPREKNPDGTGSWLVVLNGDTAVSEEHARSIVRTWFKRGQTGAEKSKEVSPELNLSTVNNVDSIWPKGRRNLFYVVDTSSFEKLSDAATIQKNLASAAKDWADACPQCGVSFTEAPSLAAAPRNSPVFLVRFAPGAVWYFALAFSPAASEQDRVLYISSLYFVSRYDHAGLLRHELGHILGYRHEDINGVPGCATEDSGNWRPVTPPDALSVMHYTCGNADGVASDVLKLNLTTLDVVGHRKIYGS